MVLRLSHKPGGTMLCLEARTIASRARESGRQERNSTGLGLQACPPLLGGQWCSVFCAVIIWWFGQRHLFFLLLVTVCQFPSFFFSF